MKTDNKALLAYLQEVWSSSVEPKVLRVVLEAMSTWYPKLNRTEHRNLLNRIQKHDD